MIKLSTNNILKYYLDSEPHFKVFVDMFLQNGFYNAHYHGLEHYEVISEIAVEVSEHTQYHNGFYLNNDTAIRYFEKGYSDIQLFSIIFALILNRSEDEIDIIANKSNSGIAFQILHAVLCDSSISEIHNLLCSDFTISQKRILLDKIKYKGDFFYREIPKDNYYSYPWRSYFDKTSLSKHSR